MDRKIGKRMRPEIFNDSSAPWRSHLWLGILSIMLISAARGQDRVPLSQRATSDDSTRIVPLYYAEDADAVMELVRGRNAIEQVRAKPAINNQHPRTLPAGESLTSQELRTTSEAHFQVQTTGAIDQVQMGLAGKGRIHLRGPLDQVNAVARMLHEIDQPVGQVKVGIHVLQLNASDENMIDGMHVAVDRLLGHARFMTRESQHLFRSAFRRVVSQLAQENPGGFAEAFFYESILDNFRILQGGKNGRISIEAFDSRDVVSTLFLTSIAKASVRQAILMEFHQLANVELPRLHKRYQESLESSQRQPEPRRFGWFRVSAKDEEKPIKLRRTVDASFERVTGYLNSLGSDDLTANGVQVAVLRSQRAQMQLRTIELEISKMREQRMLLSVSREPISGVGDERAFSQLIDSVINEKEQRAIDICEAIRGETATLDGHLRHLSEAFEEDIRRQFYQPSLKDLRELSARWNVKMGQMQSTTIVTNDRTRARVSPEQVAMMDMAKRKILLQEGLEVADGLAKEVASVSQRIATATAGDALSAGASVLPLGDQLLPAPGKHLESLATPVERTKVSVGDEIDFTPVIQPDGATVAFRLQYAHSPKSHSANPDQSSIPSSKHYIDTQVQVQNHELKEVSRFRSTMSATEQGQGVMLLEDVPVVGTLFRPRRASAASLQQNIILTDVVIYPTSKTMGHGWMAMESEDSKPGTSGPEQIHAPMNMAQWVEQKLESSAQQTLQGTSRTQIAE